MMGDRCHHEDELLDALGRGYVGADLSAHVDGCRSCSELRLVAGALLDDRADAMREAAVPSAGSMWFRMQMRHRQEIRTAAQRSLLIGQAVTLMIAIALIASFFGAEVTGGLREALASIRTSTPLLAVFLTWLLIAPIAGWVAVRQK